MHFNTIHLCFFLTLLAGGMATPIASENSLVSRGGYPPYTPPGCPTLPPSNPVTQINNCATGTPYCCSPSQSGGHTCEKADVNCGQTVICCNNNGGVSAQLRSIQYLCEGLDTNRFERHKYAWAALALISTCLSPSTSSLQRQRFLEKSQVQCYSD
jgi:hypothetical protein